MKEKLAQLKNQALLYWQKLQPREQKMLTIGSSVFAVFVVFLLFTAWVDRSNRLQAQLENDLVLLEWMQPVVSQIVLGRMQEDDGQLITAQNLLPQVESSLHDVMLSDQIVGLNLAGDNQVRLEFDSVIYESLVAWLYALSNQGVVVNELTAHKTDEVGEVQASVLLSASDV